MLGCLQILTDRQIEHLYLTCLLKQMQQKYQYFQLNSVLYLELCCFLFLFVFGVFFIYLFFIFYLFIYFIYFFCIFIYRTVSLLGVLKANIIQENLTYSTL